MSVDRWLGPVWLCPDCGKVLRRPPWKLLGDRLHSGHCPTAMVEVRLVRGPAVSS